MTSNEAKTLANLGFKYTPHNGTHNYNNWCYYLTQDNFSVSIAKDFIAAHRIIRKEQMTYKGTATRKAFIFFRQTFDIFEPVEILEQGELIFKIPTSMIKINNRSVELILDTAERL
jgi:hypothetical protein